MEQCRAFATCTDGQHGDANVNVALIDLFTSGQRSLYSKCGSARAILEDIVGLMTVPLIQGTLRAAYRLTYHLQPQRPGTISSATSDWGEVHMSPSERGEGAAYVAAVLPRLAYCSAEAARVVRTNIEGLFADGLFDGADGTTPGAIKLAMATNQEGARLFEEVRQAGAGKPAFSYRVFHTSLLSSDRNTVTPQVLHAFEEQYTCMNVTCNDIGGLWDDSAGGYVPGFSPCPMPPPPAQPPAFPAPQPWLETETARRSLLVLGVVTILLLAIFVVLRWWREWLRRRNMERAEAANRAATEREAAMQNAIMALPTRFWTSACQVQPELQSSARPRGAAQPSLPGVELSACTDLSASRLRQSEVRSMATQQGQYPGRDLGRTPESPEGTVSSTARSALEVIMDGLNGFMSPKAEAEMREEASAAGHSLPSQGRSKTGSAQRQMESRELPEALESVDSDMTTDASNANDPAEERQECAICLAPFEEGEEVKDLPCRHFFHRKCIDQWLNRCPSQTATAETVAACPLCKANPLAPTMAV